MNAVGLMKQKMIVAEISRNYPGSDLPAIGQTFELVIEANGARGYTLKDWRFSQVVISDEGGNGICETIIAIFELKQNTK
jgi:hypothetical protein